MTKLDDLTKKLNDCIASENVSGIEDIARTIRNEVAEIVIKEVGKLPQFTFTTMNDSDYRRMIRETGLPESYCESGGITNHLTNGVTINLEKPVWTLEQDKSGKSVIFNLSLVITEELVHLANPQLTEERANEIVNRLGPKYLETPVDPTTLEEFKKGVKGR